MNKRDIHAFEYFMYEIAEEIESYKHKSDRQIKEVKDRLMKRWQEIRY